MFHVWLGADIHGEEIVDTMTSTSVLVICSNPATVEVIGQTLSDAGCRAENARTGLEALRRAAARTYAFAIVDTSLPSELGGRETAAWLRRLYAMPIVELANHVEHDVRCQVETHVRHGASSNVVSARPAGFERLTEREWQIMRDLIDTPSVYAVAEKRQRSCHTVHNQLRSIYRKLGVHSIQELLGLMLRVSWTHRHARTSEWPVLGRTLGGRLGLGGQVA